MRIGCVMPTFNQIGYIEEAVDSLRGQVDDLIIVDDGSTDGTYEWLVEKMREGWIDRIVRHEKNQGTAAAINTGMAGLSSDCDWLTWQSSDNVVMPGWRESMEDCLADHSDFGDIGVVYSSFWYCKGADLSEGNRRLLYKVPYDREALISTEDCYFGPSFIIRRDVWGEAGAHRGKISHDYDHWLRVEEACWRMGVEIAGVNVPRVLYRAHHERVTITRRDQYDAKRWQAEARKRREAL